LPRRTDLAVGSPRRNGLARALAILVALVVLFVSLNAEAKKKKGGKKHKPPATKSKGKEALPASEPETDSASSDEKSSGKDDEDDEKAAKPTPPPEPVGDEDAAAKKPARTKPAPKMEDEGGPSGALAALRLGIGGAALFRQLRWTDDGGALAPYTLSPGPELRVWFEAYPAAFATDGFAANIGVFGKLDYGFGATSQTPPPASQKLTTKYMDFLAGLKVRIPFGVAIPYVAGAYGMQKFALEPPDNSRPNFNYSFIHAGAGSRFQFTPELDLDVGAGFLYVMNPGSSAGEIAAPQPLYPRATANGIDAFLSLGYRVMSLLAVRVGVDFRQFGVATGWRTGDTSVRAGGAVDRNITAWGGLEVVFDGMGGGGDSEAPPPKKAEKPKKAPAEGEEAEPAVEDSSEK
jgi:hypothetical protein